MKKLIGIVVLLLFIGVGAGHSLAGDGYIKDVTYDGSCVKVIFASTEDDSSDQFAVRAQNETGSILSKRSILIFWLSILVE